MNKIHIYITLPTVILIASFFIFVEIGNLSPSQQQTNKLGISFHKVKEIQAGDIIVLDSGRSVFALQNHHFGMVSFGKIGTAVFHADISAPSTNMVVRITKILKPRTHEYMLALLKMVEDALEVERSDNFAILPVCNQDESNSKYCTVTPNK